jgi:hypothetical protein
MRMARGAAAAVLAGALVVGNVAAASAEPVPDDTVRWTPALQGEATGVELTDGTLRLAAPPVGGTRAENGPQGNVDEDVPLGMLILHARRLDLPVNRVDAALDATDGSGVTVDIRGKRPNGKWMEWVAAEPPAGADDPATAELHTPAVQVQARIVFTPEVGMRAEVRGLTLTAYPARDPRADADDTPAVSYRVFATHEGLVGETTANGHVITEEDMFVALPSRRALSPRDGSDYSVRVCAPNGRCAYAPVWDVGPWNTRDDYWSADERQDWRDLPRGVPQAQAAKQDGHNGGKDQFGRTVLNPAGIDLSGRLFFDALVLKNNEWVTVDYLWTGQAELANVRAEGVVEVRAAPDGKARVVAFAADRAGVPVQCAINARDGRWLQIGPGQFLPAASVPQARPVPTCDRIPADPS